MLLSKIIFLHFLSSRRISAPSSEIQNDEGNITMTPKSYNNNSVKKIDDDDNDRGISSSKYNSLCNEHTSPQRKPIPDTRVSFFSPINFVL
jgi:hypothetical protein